MSFGYSTALSTGVLPLATYPLPLLDGLNANGTTLSASPSAGNFGITRSAGSTLYYISENANNNTKTDIAIWGFYLPVDYVPGSTITVNVNAFYTPGTGTVGAHTVVATAYLVGAAGTEGANLVTTAALNTATAAAVYSFAVTGTNLFRNSLLTIGVTAVTQETGAAGNITTTLNNVYLS